MLSQNKFSTVYVNKFTFIQLDERKVKKEYFKGQQNSKKISNAKSSKGKSLNNDEVVPMIDNEVPKPLLRSRKENLRTSNTSKPRKKSETE